MNQPSSPTENPAPPVLPPAACSALWNQIERLAIRHHDMEVMPPDGADTPAEIMQIIRRFNADRINQVHADCHNFERDVLALLGPNGQSAGSAAATTEEPKA